MTNKEFYTLAGKYSGIMNPFATLCQCNWETRTGGFPWSSELFLLANNAAGLKAWSGWQGQSYNKVSWEQNADGTKISKVSAFCKYPSVESFLGNYADKLNANYPLVLSRKDNFWGCFDGLLTGRYKWATDQTYFTRLCNVAIELAPEIFGDAWQSKLISAFEYAVSKNYLSQTNKTELSKLLSKFTPPSKQPVSKGRVVIDPGHGLPDPGASGSHSTEAEINLSVALQTKQVLTDYGFSVTLTREGSERLNKKNRNVDLSMRATVANRLNAGCLLSIHCNSAVDARANGYEVITLPGQDHSDKFATITYEEWCKVFPTQRKRTDYTDGDPDKEANLKVLKECHVPCCLVEMGFINNLEEEKWLLNKENQSKMAIAIANGIRRFMKG